MNSFFQALKLGIHGKEKKIMDDKTLETISLTLTLLGILVMLYKVYLSW